MSNADSNPFAPPQVASTVAKSRATNRSHKDVEKFRRLVDAYGAVWIVAGLLLLFLSAGFDLPAWFAAMCWIGGPFCFVMAFLIIRASWAAIVLSLVIHGLFLVLHAVGLFPYLGTPDVLWSLAVNAVLQLPLVVQAVNILLLGNKLDWLRPLEQHSNDQNDETGVTSP